MRSENIGIRLEELSNETFEGNEVDLRVWIKEFKVELDATLLILL